MAKRYRVFSRGGRWWVVCNISMVRAGPFYDSAMCCRWIYRLEYTLRRAIRPIIVGTDILP